MRASLLAVAVLAGLALAGCASDSADGDGAGGAEAAVAVDDGTGIIQGVVLDETVTPIGGAVVSLRVRPDDGPWITGADGRFTIAPLRAGNHFLEIRRDGFFATSVRTMVVAGAADPPLVKVTLQRNPEMTPYHELEHFTGLMQCAFGSSVTGSSLVPCNALTFTLQTLCSNDVCIDDPTGQDAVFAHAPSLLPVFIQTETVWQPSNQFSSSFLVFACAAPKGTVPASCGGDGTFRGPSVLVIPWQRTAINATAYGAENQMVYVYSAGNDVQMNLIVEQEFEVFATSTYNFRPPDGWQFTSDGPP